MVLKSIKGNKNKNKQNVFVKSINHTQARHQKKFPDPKETFFLHTKHKPATAKIQINFSFDFLKREKKKNEWKGNENSRRNDNQGVKLIVSIPLSQYKSV